MAIEVIVLESLFEKWLVSNEKMSTADGEEVLVKTFSIPLGVLISEYLNHQRRWNLFRGAKWVNKNNLFISFLNQRTIEWFEIEKKLKHDESPKPNS